MKIPKTNKTVEVTSSRAMFSIFTKTLNETLKFLKVAIPPGKKNYLTANCEITIKTDLVEFVVIGAKKTIQCKSNGPAKVCLPFCYLFESALNTKSTFSLFLVTDGVLKFEKAFLPAQTFFFNNDSILRSINLPINYTARDILQLPHKYTREEIEFNELDSLLIEKRFELETDIVFATNILMNYGFTSNEIRKLIENKINLTL